MKIVLVGHGHFATGIYSSLQLIAGNQENVEAIDFVEGMSADELKQKILLAISNEEEVLILSDLLGGSPFKVSSTIMGENPAKNGRKSSQNNECSLGFELSHVNGSSLC